ncbi:MAG: hypothetical protein UT24_C0019G0024 [Candidatus Woesebacteria bacterium GW2011_GWB1_39_12]|uniref:Uncharacterized protein n=1 Tax=Candidatus Woesebacteria bacterium GW2011_GWB1_39_12 TaxID=1618574 RepID=A0A0G0PP90_9BACT|nr:MAG: hypothetical protein UT24_C0019G0024 [Candidatus Woesebacteria bacterium GW2011_GWB1_39_12]
MKEILDKKPYKYETSDGKLFTNKEYAGKHEAAIRRLNDSTLFKNNAEQRRATIDKINVCLRGRYAIDGRLDQMSDLDRIDFVYYVISRTELDTPEESHHYAAMENQIDNVKYVLIDRNECPECSGWNGRYVYLFPSKDALLEKMNNEKIYPGIGWQLYDLSREYATPLDVKAMFEF